VFRSNLQKINDHNLKYLNGTTSYKLGITKFADWTSEEFMDYANRGLLIRPKFDKKRPLVHQGKRLDLPQSVDWRTEGFVNPVKDQGQCGSCWTYSAISTIESHYYKTNGELLKFSEQHLTDCVYLSQGKTGNDADGCQGGWMSEGFLNKKKI
jgi:C1A family cysteine protease